MNGKYEQDREIESELKYLEERVRNSNGRCNRVFYEREYEELYKKQHHRYPNQEPPTPYGDG